MAKFVSVTISPTTCNRLKVVLQDNSSIDSSDSDSDDDLAPSSVDFYVVLLSDTSGQEWTRVVRRGGNGSPSPICINPGNMLTELTVTAKGCSVPAAAAASVGGLLKAFRVERENQDEYELDPPTIDDMSWLNDRFATLVLAERALTLDVSLNEATSRLTASINWIYSGKSVDVDQWMVTINNLSWEQNDFVYHHWVYYVNGSQRTFQFPLWFRPGSRYHVTLRGLSQLRSSMPDTCPLATVVCKADVEFRTGQELTRNDMEQLLQKAIAYTNSRSSQPQYCDAKSTWLTRNKPKYYFDRILEQRGGIMKPYLKDPSGDLRCPINGEISGLFFLASPRRKNGQPRNQSPFGGSRLLMRSLLALERTPNIYFADFSCLNNNRQFHHVTLVLTRPGSTSDVFCRPRLPRLSVDERRRNPFLFRSQPGGQLTVARAVFVDVFFTEDVDVAALRPGRDGELRHSMGIIGPGTTTQGGLSKSRNCPHCDIFCGRPTAAKPAGICEF